jgi:hypothetical protein
MDRVPKNKRYAIKRLIDMDPSLNPEELGKLKIVNLLQMIEDKKAAATEIIVENVFQPRSLRYYCGLGDEDN